MKSFKDFPLFRPTRATIGNLCNKISVTKEWNQESFALSFAFEQIFHFRRKTPIPWHENPAAVRRLLRKSPTAEEKASHKKRAFFCKRLHLVHANTKKTLRLTQAQETPVVSVVFVLETRTTTSVKPVYRRATTGEFYMMVLWFRMN